MKRHTLTIYIDFDEMCAFSPPTTATRCSSSKLKEGYADLKQRVMGYLSFDNYNPNIDSRNIIMTFAFNNEPRLGFDTALHDTIVALLAHFLLMKFYGDIDPRGPQHGSSIFNLEWRRYKAKLMIAFAHDEL